MARVGLLSVFGNPPNVVKITSNVVRLLHSSVLHSIISFFFIILYFFIFLSEGHFGKNNNNKLVIRRLVTTI